jgi:hypothetical protein
MNSVPQNEPVGTGRDRRFFTSNWLKLRVYGICFAVIALAGCSKDPLSVWNPNGIMSPIVAQSVKEKLFPSLLGEGDPEPERAETPPCKHPGGFDDFPSTLKPCDNTNREHAAYWVSRYDKHAANTACKKAAPGYCAPENGMTPHCHGWGKHRFCHSHPGGAYSHTHIGDLEFAAVSSSYYDRK